MCKYAIVGWVDVDLKLECAHELHRQPRLQLPISEAALDRSARLFRALGDAARLQLVTYLAQGPACVTELASLQQQSITVISQRLRVLRADDIVSRKREGKHILYFLADQHVLGLVFNGLAHATEQAAVAPSASLIPSRQPTSN